MYHEPMLLHSHKPSIFHLVVGLGGLLIIALIIGLIYELGNQARQNMLNKQSQQYQAPTVAVKQQVKRVTIKRQTGQGEETIEIGNDGKVTRKDANGQLLQSGHQGFGSMRGLFELVEQYLENGKPIYIPQGYQLIIETNKGTVTLNPSDTTPPDSGRNIIDDIISIIDPILNPTPRPTTSPRPSPTTTSSTGPSPTPEPSPPTSTPDYTEVPPFTCADYYQSGKRIKISNVYCGPEEN